MTNRLRADIAVATDVGAWRVLEPVLRELARRGQPCHTMLGRPAAAIASRDGIEHQPIGGGSLEGQVAEVLARRPARLLLGTSVQPVAERALAAPARETRPPIPTLAVLDAMLFVERRFGAGLSQLADLVACPDPETVQRLVAAGGARRPPPRHRQPDPRRDRA